MYAWCYEMIGKNTQVRNEADNYHILHNTIVGIYWDIEEKKETDLEIIKYRLKKAIEVSSGLTFEYAEYLNRKDGGY